MRNKFLGKLQSFVQRRERRDKGLSSNSGSAASASSQVDEELSTIEIDNGSPDKIVVNKQASHQEILDMVDTDFFKIKKEKEKKAPVKIKEVAAARKASAAIEDKLVDFMFNSGVKTDMDEKT